MGATAAELGIIVDTSTVKAAVKELQDLSASGKATSADVTKASKGVVTAFAGLAGEARKAGDETFKLSQKFTPAIAAAAKMEKEFEDLQKALDTNAITLAQYQQQLDAMATRATRALGMTATATDKVTQGTVKVAEAANRSTGNMRMFGQQLSQVAQQGAATGQWAQAFAIQAADIGLAFGPVGMAIGAVLTVLPSLVMGFMEAGEGAETLDDAVDGLGSSLDDYTRYIQIAASDTADLAEKFGAFAGQVRGFSEYMAQVSLGQALDDAKVVAYQLADSISAVVGQANEADKLAAALARVEEQQRQGFAGMEQVATARDAYELVRDAAADAAADIGLTVDQARELDAAFATFGAADSLTDMREAASDALGILQQMFPAGEQLPPAFREVAAQLEAISAQTAEAVVETQNLESGAIGVADIASQIVDIMAAITDNTNGAASAASTLAGNLAAAAQNAYTTMLNMAKAHNNQVIAEGMGMSNTSALAAQYAAYGAGQVATRDIVQGGLGDISGGIDRTYGVSGGRRGGGGGGSRGGASEAAKELQQLMREGESITKAVMTAQEEYSAAIAQAARLLDVGAISQETYNRHVAQLGVELQEAQFGDLIGQVQSFTESLIRARIEGKNALEVIGNALLDVGVKLASSGFNNLFMNAIGFGGSGSGSGTGTLGLPSFDGGGYTGKSSRSGGLDGKGGFMAMLHPQETVIDHSKGQGGAQTITLNINSDPSVIVSVAEATADTKIRQNNAVRDRAFNGKARNAMANTRKV